MEHVSFWPHGLFAHEGISRIKINFSYTVLLIALRVHCVEDMFDSKYPALHVQLNVVEGGGKSTQKEFAPHSVPLAQAS